MYLVLWNPNPNLNPNLILTLFSPLLGWQAGTPLEFPSEVQSGYSPIKAALVQEHNNLADLLKAAGGLE